MKITIERVTNGYIVEHTDPELEEPRLLRTVFEDHSSGYTSSGFNPRSLKEMLSWVASEFSLYGGSSGFDSEVVHVILVEGDEYES